MIFITPIILSTITLVLSNFIDFYNWVTFFIGVVIYTVIFLVINWLFIMNNYEKDIFRIPIKNMINKLRKKKTYD